MELETQLAIAQRLGYMENAEELLQLTNTLYAKLQRLIEHLNK